MLTVYHSNAVLIAVQSAVYNHLTRVTTISADFSHDTSASADITEATSELKPDDVY